LLIKSTLAKSKFSHFLAKIIKPTTAIAVDDFIVQHQALGDGEHIDVVFAVVEFEAGFW
jgi:hypothetical protein